MNIECSTEPFPDPSRGQEWSAIIICEGNATQVNCSSVTWQSHIRRYRIFLSLPR